MNSEVLTFQAHFHLEKNKIFLKIILCLNARNVI